MRKLLHIGEVARLVGVSTKTIRYYHEIGLLAEPERTERGYRLYSAHHLLSLQRIRRLRALGLPLERIRAILNDSPQDAEKTLRQALRSLVEELSAQILELEERRSLLQALLDSDQLEPSEEETRLFFSADLKERLAPYLSGLSTEYLEWGQRVDALLGSFHWPAGYRQVFQTAMGHIADHAERYRQLFALEERLAALANLPADAPEVEQLAEDYASNPEFLDLFKQLGQFEGWEQGPFSAALMDLMSTQVLPAQKRFFELLAQKQVSNQSAKPPSQSEQEQ
jgi:DNA-binding transcriptional MerR regulator